MVYSFSDCDQLWNNVSCGCDCNLLTLRTMRSNTTAKTLLIQSVIMYLSDTGYDQFGIAHIVILDLVLDVLDATVNGQFAGRVLVCVWKI